MNLLFWRPSRDNIRLKDVEDSHKGSPTTHNLQSSDVNTEIGRKNSEIKFCKWRPSRDEFWLKEVEDSFKRTLEPSLFASVQLLTMFKILRLE